MNQSVVKTIGLDSTLVRGLRANAWSSWARRECIVGTVCMVICYVVVSIMMVIKDMSMVFGLWLVMV